MWRIATDPNPDNPNPHAWELMGFLFETEEAAATHGRREEVVLREEFGEEYAADYYRWLVVKDTFCPQQSGKEAG